MQAPPPHLALQVELRARIICHSLERTCCIVLAFLSSPLYFVSTFLSVSARSPWLPKSRRIWSKVHFCEKTDWDGVLKNSLSQEFFGGTISELKNSIIDSLCWGVRARFFINPLSLLTATRRVLSAAIPRRTVERSRYKGRALVKCSYLRFCANTNARQIRENVLWVPLVIHALKKHQWDFVNIDFGFINRVDVILIFNV